MNDKINQSLLPPNASALLRDLEVVCSKNFKLETLNQFVNNPNLAPAHILPWLAWALSVDDWNDEWGEEVKRNVIKASIEIHRKKGTIGALKKALSAFNYQNVKVEEWFNYGGDPYHFKVHLEIIDIGFDFSVIAEIKKIIKSTKNARSHLEELKAYLATKPALFNIGSILISKDVTTLYPRIYQADDLLINSLRQNLASAFISKELTTIYPQKFYLQSKALDSFLGAFFITKEIVTINRKT